ncbi:MAG: exo-alpha-sialidase, partial [Candidatus Omnitrophica bacterium]|nr:exo-alpha-sialidase [Candidatus Omnitrophota bacterium]
MKRIQGKHGVVCWLGKEKNGYFGWPTIARLDDDRLVVASSGLRRWHICPFGKTTLYFSNDEGDTWSGPLVISNSPLDDRDAGVISLGGKRILVTWFTSNTRTYLENLRKALGDEELSSWSEALEGQSEANID